METPKKTLLAVVASTVLVVGTGVVAATTILDMRVPGFAAQDADPPSAASETVATTTARDDAGPAGEDPPATTSGTVSAPAGPAPAAVAATPARAPAPAPAPSPAPAPVAPPVTDDHEESVTPARSAIPPPPAGCDEAEWDGEHQYWKCHADEHDGEHEDD